MKNASFMTAPLSRYQPGCEPCITHRPFIDRWVIADTGSKDGTQDNDTARVAALFARQRSIGLPRHIERARRNTSGMRAMHAPANSVVEMSRRSTRTAQRTVVAIPTGNINSKATSV